MKESEGIDVLESGGLNEAGYDLVIALAVTAEGTVAESDLAHNDIVAQKPLGNIVVSADIRKVQTCHKLVTFCRELTNELVGTGMIELCIQGSA